MSIHLDPQNPYRSCVVRASAGSGKTFQLSRRFLFLVGAGAHPASILTVTFTKKAAGEMRERILDTAARLLSEPEEQVAFDQKLAAFYAQAGLQHKPQPPRSAVATAEAVLASTQSLRIATIDAILLEWMRKFPFEAGGQGALAIPSPFELMSLRDEEQLHRRAWYLTVETLRTDPQLSPRWQELRAEGLDLLDLETRLKELAKHESFLWLLQKQRAEAAPLLPHPLPSEPWDASPEAFLEAVHGDLRQVCSLLTPAKAQLAIDALTSRDIDTLIELRIITRNWEVHKGTFRKPKRDTLELQIDEIDSKARLLKSYQARAQLNACGDFLLRLYLVYEKQQNRVKEVMGRLAFSDLIKGGFHLFNRPEAAGVRFLLHRTIRHLLLDEFQDTSILQWSMFSSMAAEMLAGEGLRGPDGVPSSLFIVGDAKQSIYGFREAEAEILREAAGFMVSREAADINLSASYRTAPLLLDYINEVFSREISDFPEHSAARGSDGQARVKGAASLSIGPVFLSEEEPDPLAAEARWVAQTLRRRLDDPKTPLLWDKEKQIYRRLEAGDCAVLYRASTHASTFAEALRSVSIAARMEEGHSFFERLEIRDLLAFCRWMSLPSHTEALVHCLKSPLFRVRDADLLQALYQEGQGHASRYERHLALIERLRPRYPELCRQLDQLLDQRSTLRPQALLRLAAAAGSWTEAYRRAFGQEEGVLAAANLNRFFETVSELESQGAFDWLPLWEKLEDLKASQAVRLASVSENAVQLMTIHKAKGLEFPLVILIGCGEEWEKTDPYWAKIKESEQGPGVAYVGRRSDRPAADPHFEGLDKILHEAAYQENVRLLYVALTRAQYHLIISGHQKRKQGLGFYPLLKDAALSAGAEEREEGGRTVLFKGDQPLEEAQVLSVASEPEPLETLAPLGILSSWQARPDLIGPIRILAPARLLEDAEPITSHGLGARPYAAAIGTFLHRGLEAKVKGTAFDPKSEWRSLAPAEGAQAFADAYRQALEKWQRLDRSPVFNSLLERAQQRFAELPIAFLEGDQLVRGSIDLLLGLGPQHWLVIDYKSSEEANVAQDLRALAIAKRYEQQLALYKKGIARLYPGARVDGAIFFTEAEQLIYF